ncbi:MAG: acetylornithine transaminase [Thermodesulfobacteriota bacterium]
MDSAADDFITMNRQYVLNTYGRAPVTLVAGAGCRVRDAGGREYLDFVAGLAACILGHGHPGLAKAIADQAGRLIHVSNLYHIEPQIRMAKRLVEHSFADKVFFCNSGAEANEGAIKLARKYFHDRGDHERFHVITMEGSFHGRTLATLAATGQTKYRKGFEPEVQGFSHVPFGDTTALAKAITPETAAVMIEPIQGEGGVKVPPPAYLAEVRALCNDRGCLMLLDEVQTGMGRTGKLFAHKHFGISPDVMTVAKGIAGGVPMGALLVAERVSDVLTPGTHASTFGGNPLACAAGLAVLDEVLAPGFLEEVTSKGNHLRERLQDLARRYDFITDVRGMGLMQAIELVSPCADLSKAMLERGVLLNCTAEKALRFLPPLVVTVGEIDEMIGVLESVLSSWKVS